VGTGGGGGVNDVVWGFLGHSETLYKAQSPLWERARTEKVIFVVCSEIHTKHINTLCGQNVEFVNVKHSGTYSNHWALWSNAV
jgi:hypothetical protein